MLKRNNIACQRGTMILRSKALRLMLGLMAAIGFTSLSQAEQPRRYLETVHRRTTLTSPVAPNGDLNPYALVVPPVSSASSPEDDALVDNLKTLSHPKATSPPI